MTRALVVTRGDVPATTVTDVSEIEPDTGEVAVDVAYSSLNYKDALALGGRPGIVRADRLVAGIDLVGTVSRSESPEWSPGDRVLVNGCGLGETHDGGLAERAVVPAEWLVRIPDALGPRRAAAIGTAGFTAQLAVLALEHHGADGDVVVTGATGGVGSIAVALLARAGRRVTAETAKEERHGMLRELGATEIILPGELGAESKPLESQRWSAAVDNLGGAVLAGILARTAYGGAVAACGNAASAELATSVMPFILRGVALLGVNSVFARHALRVEAWDRLARDLDLELLDGLTSEVSLAEAPAAAEALLHGTHVGRTVVGVRA